MIIDELASKYNLPKKKVEEAVRSQFKATKDVMKKEPGRSIRLISLGSFNKLPNKYLKKIIK